MISVRGVAMAAAVAVAALVAGAGEATAGIVNGDFETGTTQGWSVGGAGGRVNILCDQFPLNNYYVEVFSDLMGNGAATATLSQTFTVQGGENLAFSFGANAQTGAGPGIVSDAGVQVTLTREGSGPEMLFNINGNFLMPRWTPRSYTFLTPGTYEIRFESHASLAGGGEFDGAGAALLVDNVTLTPEPATMSLLALGGLMALRRRR